MAKIFGWNELGVRRDNIVIYLAESAIVKVLYWLAAYQRKDPKAFHPSTPKMMDQVMDGVAVASDVSEISFGEMRSRLIVDALKVAASTDKYPVFVRAVLANFRAAGIDPDAPHRHLPKSYVGDQRRHRTPASEPVDSAGSARQEAMSAHHSAQHPGDSTAVTDPLAGAGAELNWKKSAFSIADEKGDEACVSVIVVDPRLMKEGGDQAKAGRSASRVIGGQGPSYV
jgi:hypothetical protein